MDYVPSKSSRKESKHSKRDRVVEKELPKGYQLDRSAPAAYKLKSEVVVDRPKSKKMRSRDAEELTEYEKTLFERPSKRRHADKDRDEDYHRSKKQRSRSSSSSRKHRGHVVDYPPQDSRIVQYSHIDEREEMTEARFSTDSSSSKAADSDSAPERESAGSEEVSALEHDRMRLLKELQSLEEPVRPETDDDDSDEGSPDPKPSKKWKRPRLDEMFERDGGAPPSRCKNSAAAWQQQQQDITAIRAQLEQKDRDIAAATASAGAGNIDISQGLRKQMEQLRRAQAVVKEKRHSPAAASSQHYSGSDMGPPEAADSSDSKSPRTSKDPSGFHKSKRRAYRQSRAEDMFPSSSGDEHQRARKDSRDSSRESEPMPLRHAPVTIPGNYYLIIVYASLMYI